MSRPRPHRDSLADQVADSFLPNDLARAIDQLPRSEKYLVHYLLRHLAEDDPDVFSRARLDKALAWVRLNPSLRELLQVYLDDRIPAEAGRCLVCRTKLERRARGRPAKYCGANHRKQAHRARQRAVG